MAKINLLFPVIFILVIILVEITLLKNPLPHSSKKLPDISTCHSKDFKDKEMCWEDLLDNTLNQNGINDTFLVFDQLYKSEPTFASGCHSYAHLLGAAAYKIYATGKQLDFPPQTAYCGYGFYHGLTELLLQKQGPAEAGKLCDSEKPRITQILYDACYHGIGHGTLSSSARDPSVWGNPQKMIDYAIDGCKEATIDEKERSRCASGVFMELTEDFNNGQLSLDSLKDDPLSICRQQAEPIKIDCYSQSYGLLSQLSQGDLKRASEFIEGISEDKYALDSMIDLAGALTNINGDQTKNISTCRSLQKRLQIPCIQGIDLAFLLKGQPGIEYERAIDFCKSVDLNEEERKGCFELLLRHSSESYDSNTMKLICQKVDKEYTNNFCD